MTEVRKQMRQTTIRFDAELWRRIDEEAARIGISAAQYIRDATLIRLTQEAQGGGHARPRPEPTPVPDAARVIRTSGVITSESDAVWAQARQARERARQLRDESRRLSATASARAEKHGGMAEHATKPEAT